MTQTSDFSVRIALSIVLGGVLALTGCSSVASDGDGPAPPGIESESDSGGGDSGASDAGGSDTGSATVTVDGATWTYDSYGCAVGYEQTSSDVYSFSSTSFTTEDGEQIQVLVDVRDDSGQNLVAGEGVEYEITVYDYGNSEAPSIDVQVTGTEGVSISGDSIVVDGSFSDFDGNTFSIQIDARCSSR